MEFGLGVLGWPPDKFWNSTFYELSCAYIGNCRAFARGRWGRRPDGWTQVEIEEHKEEVKALQERHPDGPLPKHVAKEMRRVRRELGLKK